MLLAASLDSSVYRVLFLLHILSIVVAFAPAVIHPLMTARLKGRNDGSLRPFLVEAAPLGRVVYGAALVAAGFFGILLTLVGDVWEFSQAWISIAFVLWFVMLGVMHGMLLPGERAWGEGDEAAEGKVQLAGGILTVLFLLMLVDMIWKPGFP